MNLILKKKLNISEYIYKIEFIIKYKIVSHIKKQKFSEYFFISFWHSIIVKNNLYIRRNINYLSSRPHPGAGIGHQISNWTSGIWYAEYYGLKYAYYPFCDSFKPFSKSKWDEFLGLYQSEMYVDYLINYLGYKIVHLPYFDENDICKKELISKIIKSYENKKVVFMLAQDQLFSDQFQIADTIRYKFESSESRKYDNIIYSSNEYNIAIHIRRGDLSSPANINQLNERWLNTQYYLNVLDQLNSIIDTNNAIRFYIFSQGDESEFIDFKRYDNIEFCLNMSDLDSFLHLTKADVLITSKSSFSYIPALINRNIKICPKNFWHGYPNSKEWVLTSDEGKILSRII